MCLKKLKKKKCVQWSFVLQFWFCMDLIAATRAEGGLVFVSSNMEATKIVIILLERGDLLFVFIKEGLPNNKWLARCFLKIMGYQIQKAFKRSDMKRYIFFMRRAGFCLKAAWCAKSNWVRVRLWKSKFSNNGKLLMNHVVVAAVGPMNNK